MHIYSPMQRGRVLEHPSDDYDWPDAQPWRQYADDDFVFYSNPARDGLRKKVLKFASGLASYHLVAYFSDCSSTLPTPSTDRNFLELIYKV
jgi:hypothetical protein